MSKVSIVIPCYNDAKYIEHSVESAVNQTHQDKEIIVVDDGSNRETKMKLKKLIPKINLLLTQENMGPAAARNRGIEVAKGDYILTLDSDDYFDPSFCSKALSIFKEDKEAKVVTCYARWFKRNKTFQIFRPKGGDLKNYLVRSCAIGNSLFLKKDWYSVGGYDENMIDGWEDWEFFIRLHINGGKTHVIPEILFHYRQKNNSRTKIANKDRFGLLEYIYNKHADLYQENSRIFIPYLIKTLQKVEKEKNKSIYGLEARLGRMLLKPLRFLKSFK